MNNTNRKKTSSFKDVTTYLTLILLCTFFISGCSDNKQAQRKIPPAPVTSGLVKSIDTPFQLPAIGTVEAINSITVRSKVTGYLSEVFIKDGQTIQNGQKLFTIDPTPFEANIRQYKAELASDNTKYEQARRDYNRYKDLVRRKVVSSEQFEQKRLEMRTALDSISVTEAKLKNAQNDLNYCFIKSPIDGLAGYVYKTSGNLIQKNEDQLVVINQISPIAVNFYLPQKYLPLVQKYYAKNQLKVITSIEGSDKTETGELKFIDNNVDKSTGTIWLQAQFENRDHKLWPGNYVSIELELFTEDAIRIPMEAPVTGPNGKYVWVIKDDNSVEMRPIEISRRYQNDDVISKGLKPGEKIVTDGQLRLFPTAKVVIKNEKKSTLNKK